MLTTKPDAVEPAPFFLRGRNGSLLDVCPRFHNSNAPILFHLPEKTTLRLIENLNPLLVGSVFVMNGRSGFGLDQSVVTSQLPRWKAHSDRAKSVTMAGLLAPMLIQRSDSLDDAMLIPVIEVTAYLCERKLLSESASNSILQGVLPLCLERSTLNRTSLLQIVESIRKIPVSRENAVLFPMIANFASWFLERNRVNRIKRNAKLGKQKQAAALLPDTSTTTRTINS